MKNKTKEALPSIRALVADTGKQTGKNKAKWINGQMDNTFPMRVAIATFEKYGKS